MNFGSSTLNRFLLGLAILMLSVSVEKLMTAAQNQNPSKVRSKISIYDLASKSVRVVYAADKLWEAPNWSPDGKYLLANSGGALYRFVLDANGKAQPEKLALDAAYECNNDHGLSPDGKRLAFSAKYGSSQESQAFVASSDGAKPRLLTPNHPSYFHGWSPDGKWLAFVAERGGHFNIFRIPVGGGSEQRLTSSAVYDDGPDYSPDGKWIYINSNRSGSWDIWRFPAEGAGPGDGKAERVAYVVVKHILAWADEMKTRDTTGTASRLLEAAGYRRTVDPSQLRPKRPRGRPRVPIIDGLCLMILRERVFPKLGRTLPAAIEAATKLASKEWERGSIRRRCERLRKTEAPVPDIWETTLLAARVQPLHGDYLKRKSMPKSLYGRLLPHGSRGVGGVGG